jgi:multiple antibiotic resistance protein
MEAWPFALLALSSLLAIVDPIGLVPWFLAMTPHDSPQVRERMARIGCLVAAGILMGFATAGMWVFRVLGLTLPAFQIAGSILLMQIGLEMLQARRSGDQATPEDAEAASAKDDIAITPLAVPMLAGPGALSSTLILVNQAHTWIQWAVLYASIAIVCALSYVILRLAAHGGVWLSPIVMRILTRLMGLLVTAIAVQFMINALVDLGVLVPLAH